MKLIVKTDFGNGIKTGDVLDLKDMDYISIKIDGTPWIYYLTDLTLQEEEPKDNDVKKDLLTLKEMLGQDVKMIEFR